MKYSRESSSGVEDSFNNGLSAATAVVRTLENGPGDNPSAADGGSSGVVPQTRVPVAGSIADPAWIRYLLDQVQTIRYRVASSVDSRGV